MPDDLSAEVVLHLRVKAKEVGLECLYWGATKLTALVNKYPYIRDAFPEIFLPDVKQGLAEVKNGVDNLNRKQDSFMDIITDDEFFRQKTLLAQEGQNKARQMANAVPPGSAQQQISQVVMQEANKKIQLLTAKKDTSDRFYELARDEITEYFDEERTKKQSEIASRGLTHSGIGQQALDEVETKRKRELERLNLKYGKNTTAS